MIDNNAKRKNKSKSSLFLLEFFFPRKTSSRCRVFRFRTHALFASLGAGRKVASYLIIVTRISRVNFHSANTPAALPEAVSLHRSRRSKLRRALEISVSISVNLRPPRIITARFVLRERGKYRAPVGRCAPMRIDPLSILRSYRK